MTKQGFKRLLLTILYIVLLVFLFVNIKEVLDILGVIVSILMPFIYGFLIAYVLNTPTKFFYEKAFRKIGTKTQKGKTARGVLSLVCSYVIVFGLVALLIVFVAPQLAKSVKALIQDIPGYLVTIQNFVNKNIATLNSKFGLRITKFTSLQDWINAFSNGDTKSIGEIIGKVFPTAIKTVTTTATSLYNWIIGIIISIYMLVSKDKLILGLKKIIVATLSDKKAKSLFKVGNISNQKCGRYIIGKLLEALILGVVYLILLTVFDFEYASLIALIMCVTNLIPFFGPIIGGIPSGLLLFMVDPMQCFWFVVICLILQQIDGNILGPKILGNSVGLSGFWILVSVILGGGLFGIPGMLLAVPVFAVIYTLVQDSVNYRLKKKAEKATENLEKI